MSYATDDTYRGFPFYDADRVVEACLIGAQLVILILRARDLTAAAGEDGSVVRPVRVDEFGQTMSEAAAYVRSVLRALESLAAATHPYFRLHESVLRGIERSRAELDNRPVESFGMESETCYTLVAVRWLELVRLVATLMTENLPSASLRFPKSGLYAPRDDDVEKLVACADLDEVVMSIDAARAVLCVSDWLVFLRDFKRFDSSLRQELHRYDAVRDRLWPDDGYEATEQTVPFNLAVEVIAQGCGTENPTVMPTELAIIELLALSKTPLLQWEIIDRLTALPPSANRINTEKRSVRGHLKALQSNQFVEKVGQRKGFKLTDRGHAFHRNGSAR